MFSPGGDTAKQYIEPGLFGSNTGNVNSDIVASGENSFSTCPWHVFRSTNLYGGLLDDLIDDTDLLDMVEALGKTGNICPFDEANFGWLANLVQYQFSPYNGDYAA